MKKILGLDLGTNSIGWALINHDFESKQGEILGLGSRIIPTDPTVLSRFGSGQPLSKAKAGQSYTPTGIRTDFRGARRLRERFLLRRERLHRVLNIIGFLPQHYANEINFDIRLGQFKKDKEPKIAYTEKFDRKFEFIFQKSFNEMVADFRKTQPQLFYIKRNGEETKIPYDWTIYYLRKKALSKKIEKEELAWILLNFNQKRGYYQLRGEDDEIDDNKNKSFEVLKVSKVVDSGDKIKGSGATLYDVFFENGWKYDRQTTKPEDWIGKTKEFIVTTTTLSSGVTKLSFKSVDSEKDWIAIKQKTEQDISISDKTVGEYIYDTLLQQPNQKIRGRLIRTIERKFYKDELRQILEKQKEFHSELRDKNLYNLCINELYEYNDSHRNSISSRDFTYLFIDDIIFYQRQLRSQKSTIINCSLEFIEHKINKRDENGTPIKDVFEKDKNGDYILAKKYLKGIPKSNPYYQEYRVWQWVHNLKIYTREDDKDVTSEFIKNVSDLEKLFEFLIKKNEVNNKDVIEYLIKTAHKNNIEKEVREMFPKLNDEKINAKVRVKLRDKVKELLPKYRWNYVFDNSKEQEEDKSKKYPCNSTGSEIRKRLEKVANVPIDFLTREKEYQLWHIIYSIKDKNEFEKKALVTFAKKNNLDETSFVENFKNFKPFANEYGSYSEKAIKKLLPLMRIGRYWNKSEIPTNVIERAKSIKERLDSIEDEQSIENVADDDVSKPVLRSFFKFKNSDLINFIQGLQQHQAKYLVYGRHSESDMSYRWKISHDIQEYLDNFRQYSLRNPVVEQVVTETLRLVKDIWEHEAVRNNIQPTMVYDEHKKRDVKSYPRVFDEIHIELGREMKNTAEDRQAITSNILENETTNLRIKKMLLEFSQDDSFINELDYTSHCREGEDPTFYKKGSNPIRPYSRSQFDILKIFEDDVLSQFSEQELKNQNFNGASGSEAKNVFEISRKSEPTSAEITRYKLWLEQRYISPYTGEIIPLVKLFTPAYEIDHIIPRSRYFDDSYNNKVICEAEVNLFKSNRLGLEFIKNEYGQKVQIGNKTVKICTEDVYKEFVLKHYKNNNKKRKNLLLCDIPDKMIERQLNDTRYISKFISGLLSNIVRSETNDNGVNSTNLIHLTGAITSTLRQSWGLNDKWNELILPRFQRMNYLTKSEQFTAKNNEGHTIPTIPFKYSKGFQFKRIDHRHHALDALVIACATREHVQYLNNENAKSQKFHLQKGLARKLREFKRVEIEKMENKSGVWVKSDKTETREVPKAYFKPWANFPIEAKTHLEKVVVSFKKNNRVINKTVNYYQKWVKQSDGSMKKTYVKQGKGDNWAVRKPLHEDFPYGKVDLKWHTPKKGTYSLAIRKDIDTSFSEKKIKKNVTDLSIQKILLKHLSNKKYQNKSNEKGELIPPEKLAFSPEGIEDMNKNIQVLNGGKKHQPIYKVRIFEDGTKFQLSENPNSSKSKKYMGTATGTNTFSIYQVKGKDKRLFETVPLNEVIAYQKLNSSEKKDSLVLPKNILPLDGQEVEVEFLFDLSPGEIVYVPHENETVQNVDFNNLTKEQIERLYKYDKASGNQAYFIRCDIASLIKNYDSKSKIGELGSQNKLETTMCEDKIKIIDKCWKVEINRLGNIVKVMG